MKKKEKEQEICRKCHQPVIKKFKICPFCEHLAGERVNFA